MATKSRVKKPIYVSAEERAKNQAIIDAVKNKFIKKTFKAQATFKKSGSKQEYVSTGRFVDEDDAKEQMQAMANALHALDSKWKLVSIIQLNVNDEQDDANEET